MPFDLTIKKSGPVDAKRAAIDAAKASSAAAAGKNPAAITRYIPPAECANRIRIVFDDSSSMGDQVENAKKGVVEFLRNCIPNQTAVAVHYMNTTSWSTSLRSDLPQLGADVTESNLQSGGTPFFNTLKKALEATPTLTRLVAFTDGSPTDQLQAEEGEQSITEWVRGTNALYLWIKSADVIIKIAKAREKTVPIDTVFFGSSEYLEREISLLKYLSDATGGFFLHFDPAKPNIWKQLKYLAPVNRLMLASESFRASVESGDKK